MSCCSIFEFASWCEADNWTPAVQKALSAGIDGLFFPAGEYHFYASGCDKRYCFFTNNDEGLKNLIFNVENRGNFAVTGDNARFIFHDRVVPFRFAGVNDLELGGFSVDFFLSPVIEAEVAAVEEEFITLRLPEERPYWIIDGKVCFINDEYKFMLKRSVFNIFDRQKGEISAGKSFGVLGFEGSEIAPHLLRMRCFRDGGVQCGDTVVFKPEPRLTPGIVLDGCSRVSVDKLTLYCAGGMGIVAQNSFDITLNEVNIGVAPGSSRVISVADDAVHFANCGGRIVLEKCRFERQLDDAVNIHGLYRSYFYLDGHFFKAEHYQQFGVDFIRAGEILEIAGEQLKVREVHDGKQYCEVIFEKEVPPFPRHTAALNFSRQPDVQISNCVFRNSKPRGVLVSSGGKVVIENNEFHTPGGAVFIAGDANFWFEAGPVRDVLIRNNFFDNCLYQGGSSSTRAVIDLNPEVPETAGKSCFHRNVRICDNLFRDNHGCMVRARSTDDLVITGNRWEFDASYSSRSAGEHFVFEECGKVTVENNTVTR